MSRGSKPSLFSAASSASALGGVSRYSTTCGSTPAERSSSSVARDFEQRGLCQMVRPVRVMGAEQASAGDGVQVRGAHRLRDGPFSALDGERYDHVVTL